MLPFEGGEKGRGGRGGGGGGSGKVAALLLAVLVLLGLLCSVSEGRIPPAQRKFTSVAVNELIARYLPRFIDPELGQLFENCLPNTLDTTVQYYNITGTNLDAFIITGDIDAMWLRDSMNQVLPYVPFATQDKPLSLLLCGLIKRSVANVLWDPYANAFNYANEGGPNQGDTRKPPMTLHVYEGKYELDSLLAVLKLSYQYWNATQSASCFDNAWLQAVTLIVNTMMVQQAGTEETLANPPYLFARQTTVATDTLMLQMQGPPAKRCGLIKTAFRPSDDATTLPFNIASNAMAVVELQHLSEMLLALNLSPLLAKQALLLANTIQQAIHSVGIISRTDVGRVYAYEVDGFGSALFMDDANLPSLLSLPYLGYVAREDPLYLNTRKLVLSAANPYFSSGTVAAGVGSPHTGLSYIWPMALIMQALTSNNDTEIALLLDQIKASSAGMGFMHESFWKDDANRYTRPWFAWANSLFGELILALARERPHLIFFPQP